MLKSHQIQAEGPDSRPSLIPALGWLIIETVNVPDCGTKREIVDFLGSGKSNGKYEFPILSKNEADARDDLLSNMIEIVKASLKTAIAIEKDHNYSASHGTDTPLLMVLADYLSLLNNPSELELEGLDAFLVKIRKDQEIDLTLRLQIIGEGSSTDDDVPFKFKCLTDYRPWNRASLDSWLESIGEPPGRTVFCYHDYGNRNLRVQHGWTALPCSSQSCGCYKDGWGRNLIRDETLDNWPERVPKLFFLTPDSYKCSGSKEAELFIKKKSSLFERCHRCGQCGESFDEDVLLFEHKYGEFFKSVPSIMNRPYRRHNPTGSCSRNRIPSLRAWKESDKVQKDTHGGDDLEASSVVAKLVIH